MASRICLACYLLQSGIHDDEFCERWFGEMGTTFIHFDANVKYENERGEKTDEYYLAVWYACKEWKWKKSLRKRRLSPAQRESRIKFAKTIPAHGRPYLDVMKPGNGR